MHVPVPMTAARGRVRALRLVRAVLASTGWYATVPVLALAVVLTVAFPDGKISHFGPLELNPQLRVLVAVPLLMAVAVGISQGVTPRSSSPRRSSARVGSEATRIDGTRLFTRTAVGHPSTDEVAGSGSGRSEAARSRTRRAQSASSRDSTKCVSASRQAFSRLGRMTSVRMPC